jgi:uroporphyrinogen decarboxylase
VLCQIIQVFDSWAGELSPSSFKQFSQPYLTYIAKHLPPRLKEMGLEPVPMVVFPKGAWYALDAACDMGYDIVGLDWLHDPAEAVKIVGDRPIVLQGNADPGVLYGSHAAITQTVTEMVKGFDWANRKKGWIVNLGHGSFIWSLKSWHVADIILGITPFVNPDDLKFFFQEIHRLTKTDA